jgi:hypothetical protein
VDEYVCVTVRSTPGEGADAFNKRLVAFWSHMLRGRPDDFERVYAETTKFQPAGEIVTRTYLVETEVADVVAAEFTKAGIDHAAIDMDDIYSKYEATPPDWFQIEH